jgi:hypothetical protein
VKPVQVLHPLRIYRHMEPRVDESGEPVRCLACRLVYVKPASGTTVGRNPGCPQCGYVGWLSVRVPLADPAPPNASA